MNYGNNTYNEFQQLDQKYRDRPPSLVANHRQEYPKDYLRYLELKKEHSPSGSRDNSDELRKIELTEKAKKAEKAKRFKEAGQLRCEIALICHRQGKEDDAYLAEHRAKQCLYRQIYLDAEVSILAFDDVPNVDKLQNALTDAAQKALSNQEYGTFTVYNLINARICHAQGKEQDACWLEDATKSYGFFEKYFIKTGNRSAIFSSEEICLEHIAKKYKSQLYPK